MLRSLNELIGYGIHARNGDIGKVEDFYFDDSSWTIRYLVARAGGWLLGRSVLLSPVALGQPDPEEEKLPVGLTKEQVKNSPDINLDRPVSRQHELELTAYYGWPTYWGAPIAPDMMGAYPAAALLESEEPAPQEEGNPHLRSVREVSGYHIHAQDGEIGHVADFIAGDADWTIRYLVVDTGNWLPGKKVLLAPPWISAIEWPEARVEVSLPRQAIKSSPEYDPSRPVSRAYEEALHAHYDRTAYWLEP